MNHSKFAVISFENRNGVRSWRVDGHLHGVRIRKNFKTREEAAAEKAVLEIKALQMSAGLHLNERRQGALKPSPTKIEPITLREVFRLPS